MENRLEHQQQIVDDAINLFCNMRNSLIDFIDQYGTFRFLDGFSKYMIYDLGFVHKKSIIHYFFKIMKDGHEKVLIKDDAGNQKWFPVCMLVAKTFIPNPDNL